MHPFQKTEEVLYAALLAAIALQGLNVLTMSSLGILPWCWISALLILIALASFKFQLWKKSTPADKHELTSAWRSPWPWLFAALLVTQIALYPPTMSDSLCYRLPRLFLVLQEGRITRVPTPDDRMIGMPWGWEMLALPFASLNLLNASKLINLACWAITFQLLFSLLRQRNILHSKARWIALTFASTPAFLLQATSTANDLYAATMLLIGVWMIHRFTKSPGSIPVMTSLLALILAANAKPQFLVLGLPWLLWWIFAPNKPWKQNPWWILATAAPIYFLLSPLPTLTENYIATGNLLANDPETTTFVKPAAHIMATAGTIQFLASQSQLPIFPGAEAYSALLRSLPGMDYLNQLIPKFRPGAQMLITIDGASFGLIHFLTLISGILLSIRKKLTKHWPWFAAFAFGIIVSSSQVVPATIGRAFMGFFCLLLPLAAWGIANIQRPRILIPLCLLATATGMTAMILNPSSPLWPSRKAEHIAKQHNMKALSNQLEEYNGYQKRSQTGADILNGVPYGEPVAVLIRQVTPVSPIWQPDWKAHHIRFINDTDPAEFIKSDTDWLVVTEKSAEFFPEQFRSYSNLPGWSIVHKKEYLPNLSQGPETWTLHKRD